MKATKHVVGKDFHPVASAKCDACGERLMPREWVYVVLYVCTPWKAEDDEDNDYGSFAWHVGCDEGSLAADGAA